MLSIVKMYVYKNYKSEYFHNVPTLLVDAYQITSSQKGVVFFIIKIRPDMRLPILIDSVVIL